jgi:hypothetical protein
LYAHLKEPRGDQVGKEDSGGDDQGVCPGEWSVIVHSRVIDDNERSVAWIGSNNSGEKIKPLTGSIR